MFKKPVVRVFAIFVALFLIGLSLIVFGPRNDAVTIAQERKAGVLTAENVNLAFEKVSSKLVVRDIVESQRVKKGDVLLQLDATDTRLAKEDTTARLSQIEALIAGQEVTVATAKSEYQRARNLIKTGAVSRSVFDTARNAFSAADAHLKQLLAQKAQLEVALKSLSVQEERLTIRAPEDGKIVKIMYQLGELVPAGAPAVLLESDRQYYDVYMNETQVAEFKEEGTVLGFAPAIGKTDEGKVRFRVAAPSFADLRNTREKGLTDLTTYQVRIYITPQEGLLPGMTIEVKND